MLFIIFVNIIHYQLYLGSIHNNTVQTVPQIVSTRNTCPCINLGAQTSIIMSIITIIYVSIIINATIILHVSIMTKKASN
jgi:hypothetical protein